MLELLDRVVDKTVVEVLQAGPALIMGGGVHEMRDMRETRDAQETWDAQEMRVARDTGRTRDAGQTGG